MPRHCQLRGGTVGDTNVITHMSIHSSWSTLFTVYAGITILLDINSYILETDR